MNDNKIIVLGYTAHYKNTYGGNTNLRFTYANNKTGISEQDWLSAQSELVTAGLLRKNFSITPEGRQLVPESMYIT